MSVYIVQGKLGTGKGKYVIGKIKEALLQGRRCVTNCDLNMEHLLPANHRATVSRVPDKPTAADLDSVGHGNPDSYDETKNGVLVLDELGSWLNARSYQNAHRAELLDWLIHARKKGWDCYLIVQALDMVDKQVRTGIAEYLVKCIRADKIKIPIVGRFLGDKGKLPRFHVAVTTLADVPGVKVDTEYYRGDDLHAAYDTRQIFRDWCRNPQESGFKKETFVGPFSYLSAWHLKGRHMSPSSQPVGFLGRLFPSRPRPQLKPKHPLIDKLSRLDRDKAWHYARLLNSQGLICTGT